MRVTLRLNGREAELDLPPNRTLLDCLRDDLDLLGANKACESGDCGCCIVLCDGEPVCSCLMLAVEADGHEVLTIEGLADGERLHPVQQAFVDKWAVQCGFCTPGMVLSAVALLRENPRPSDEDVREALAGNLCRCTGYAKIVEAVLKASEVLSSEFRVQSSGPSFNSELKTQNSELAPERSDP